MADNTEETKPSEGAEGSEQAVEHDEFTLSGDQSFTYWIVMLPFLAIAGVFVFEFSKHPTETNRLINAAGAVIVGLLVSSMVTVLSGASGENKEESSGESPKPEGSS